MYSTDWAEDRTWTPSQETQDVSTSEEENAIIVDSESESETEYIATERIRLVVVYRNETPVHLGENIISSSYCFETRSSADNGGES